MTGRKRIVGALLAGAVVVALAAAWGTRHVRQTRTIDDCEPILADLEARLAGPASCSHRELEDLLQRADARRGTLSIDATACPAIRKRAAKLDDGLRNAREIIARRETALASLFDDVGKHLQWSHPDLERAAERMRRSAGDFAPPDASVQQLQDFIARLDAADFDAARQTLVALRKTAPARQKDSPALQRITHAVAGRQSQDGEVRAKAEASEARDDRLVYTTAFDAILDALLVPDFAAALAALDDADQRLHRPSYHLKLLRDLVTHWLAGDEASVQDSFALMRKSSFSAERAHEIYRIESAYRMGRNRQRAYDDAERQAQRIKRFQPLVDQVRAVVDSAPAGYFRNRRNQVDPVIAGTAVIFDLSTDNPHRRLVDAPVDLPPIDKPATIFCIVERKEISFGGYYMSARLTYGYLVADTPGEYVGPATGESVVIAVIDWPRRQILGWQTATEKPPQTVDYASAHSGFKTRMDMKRWIKSVPEL